MKSVPDNFPVKDFQQKLISWWKHKGRNFPWRNSSNPYHILIAEVLLHRTRADQVVPVYLEFLKRFPSIEAIASVPHSEVKNMLYSLGLHWRAEFLYRMATEITQRYGGHIPEQREKLEFLPGVSRYIASAVRCFAFGYPEVLPDTNTVRITGRVFGIPITDGSRRSKQFRELLQFLLDPDHPREFNFALIDLGALICRPKRPFCHLCPVSNMCLYGRQEERNHA